MPPSMFATLTDFSNQFSFFLEVQIKVKTVGNSWMYCLKKKCAKKQNNYMRLNKYLFNRVNNKECERGQRSVVWLKHGQPCLHHLHVLSTVFSWRPFSLCLAFGSVFYPHPSPPLTLNNYSSTVQSVWRVPGSISVGAHGWGARVCQPWGHNSV